MAVREGTVIADTLRIQDDDIPAPVIFQNEANGGVHSVTTLALRDAIPAYYRIFGMLCSVTADPTPANNTIYRLWPTIDANKNNNANWSTLSVLLGGNLQDVTDVGSVTTNPITVAGITNSGTLTQSGIANFALDAVIGRELIASRGILGSNSENIFRGATVFGFEGKSTEMASKVHSGGKWVNNGDIQARELVMRMYATNTSLLAPMFTGDGGFLISDISIPDFSSTSFEILFSAAANDGNVKNGRITGIVKKSTGTPNVFSDTVLFSPYDGSINAPYPAAETSSGQLRILFQGTLAKDIYVVAHIKLVTTSYNAFS